MATSLIRRRPGYVLPFDPLVAEEEDDVLMGTLSYYNDDELKQIVDWFKAGVNGGVLAKLEGPAQGR